nr:MAG TPA: DEAD-like helicase [Ackermannviridae sp.]
MSNNSNPLNIAQYLKKVAESYSGKTAMTDIYEQFRCMSKEYEAFNEEDTDQEIYSSVNFKECSKEEQDRYLDSVLSMVSCLITNSIYDKVGIVQSWKDVWMLTQDPIYKNVEKASRKVVFSVSSNNRPIGEKSFSMWNGIQIIDIDIKNKKIANELKLKIFEDLNKYHWFLGVAKSASGKSLHVWTKITPISYTDENKKIEYLCNFRHKYSYLYIVLTKYMKEIGYTKDDIFDWMDMAMAKPQQGIFITSDSKALLSTNFIDLRLDANFETAFDTGLESIDWISHPDLKNIFAKLEWFNTENNQKKSVDITAVSDINDVDPSKCIRRHYKHAQRWQLANTLTSLYGYDKALQYMVAICDGTDYKELKGDVKTASIHDKPVSVWAIKQLNKYHGFNIKIEDDNIYKEEQKSLTTNEEDEKIFKSPTDVLNDKDDNLVKLHLNKDQYLSDLKDDILKNLNHITLLEAGAGYGKTEMIKAFKAKTLLILPFTSTIKAKIETSSVTSDWLYYYGNKKPSLEDLLSNKSMSMTIDKFSRLNVMELDTAGFEYIVLDESHLIFTSSYRDVMAPTIQRLANCKAKIIMMTGTPTGEMLFFPGIKHIKVEKDDYREKSFELNMCPTKVEQMIEMAHSMAKDIKDGKKILYPTNKGNLWYEQLTGLVQQYLDDMKFGRQINCFYYKKSNYGEESMDLINFDKSIGNNDIVFCTTYLSVGVDICDKFSFSVYFNEQWIPQDIEQFANRLRNNNLYLKMFLPKKDSVGMPINYYYTQPLDLSLNQGDLLLARDLIKTCNDMIERNNEESKYNPFIQSLLSTNKYLKYDENQCKYFIDETTYKLSVFEDRYASYMKQLPMMIEGLQYYGYVTNVIDHEKEISEDRLEFIEDYLKSCRHMRFNQVTVETLDFLDHVNDGNIDLYRELISGNYNIFKDDEYREMREDNNLYVKDIEIMERNVPIVLSLYKNYNIDTIKDIYKYCIDKKQNRINFSKLNRIRKFVSIEQSRRKRRLDFPILRFVKDAQKWADDTMKCTREEIDEWLKEYACKYANSVKDVVVEDKAYLEKIYDLTCNLWKIVIDQSKPKNGIITIRPFEMLWDTKQEINEIYQNNITKQFFLQELIENIKIEDETKKEETLEEYESKLPENLPHTSKYKLEQIESQLKNVIHDGYDYSDYASKDGTNKRFVEKMENTNSLRGTIFGQNLNKSEDTSYMKKVEEKNLFEDCPF